MSVINQMLKDLDQRSPEANTQQTKAQNIAAPYSPIKIVLFTTISVLVICSMALYAWQLSSENESLKAQQALKASATELTPVKTLAEANSSPAPDEGNLSNDVAAKIDEAIEPAYVITNVQSSPISKPRPEPRPELRNASSQQPRKVSATAMAPSRAQLSTGDRIVNNGSSKVTPAKQDKSIAHNEDHSHAEGSLLSHSHNNLETTTSKAERVVPKAKAKTNAMTVSRRQLSADELAQQKLALAEKALAAKQVTAAEKLLEDVVIITPNDSQTRKKLAALWFGRQAYQDAVNLLSQGIALNSKDSSLRQMKARIHLKQGQVTAALNTLKPLAQLKDEQYQIMLANTAQQANHTKSAVGAYQMLINMQPDMGRWQLGLAVLYDKDSQFDLATQAYKTALTKNDLSVSSEQFIKERIQAIGQ